MRKINDDEGLNDPLDDSKRNDYEILTEAAANFSDQMIRFWDSIAFPKIVDENPDISADILKASRNLNSTELPYSSFSDELKSKLQVISEFDPYKNKRRCIISKKWEYAWVSIWFYSNGVEHNQCDITFDMDEMEFIMDCV